MKNDPSKTGFFDRFMDWAQEDPNASKMESTEISEKAEFMEYLDYLNSNETMEYNDFRDRFLHSDNHDSHATSQNVRQTTRSRRRKGLRKWVWVYRILSVVTVALLMWTLILVATDLPAFGDIHAPTVNEVANRYLEKGLEETGAVNAVAGMILDYRAFDTFGESTVLFAATISIVLLMRRPSEKKSFAPASENRIFVKVGRLLLPFILMYGIYVVLNGHLSPGGGFSGGTVLGCGLILGALVLGEERMYRLLPPTRVTHTTVICLLMYGLMKGYSFYTGANHVGWEIPKGIPGAILSSGFILPLNICVGIIVAGTMYTFYTLFAETEE